MLKYVFAIYEQIKQQFVFPKPQIILLFHQYYKLDSMFFIPKIQKIYIYKQNQFMNHIESPEDNFYSSKQGKITSSTGFGNSQLLRTTRSTSSSQLNVKGKLNGFFEILDGLRNEIQQLQNETNQSKRYSEIISKTLQQNIEVKQLSLTKSIKSLQSQMNATYSQQNNRIKKIKGKIDQLFKQRLSIKQVFCGFRARIQSVENAMGYYDGHDKYES